MLTTDEETILKKLALKDKLQSELKVLYAERDVLYSAKDTEMEIERLKAEQTVNDKHMPAINAKDQEMQLKEDEINAIQ